MSNAPINPDNFTIPSADPATLETLASSLRSDGETLSEVGYDVKSSWAEMSS